MKKLTVVVSILIVIGLVIFSFYFIAFSKQAHTENYLKAEEQITKCNNEMIEGNKSDWCTSYHDYYMECTYGDGKLNYCFNGNPNQLILAFNLSESEAKKLCTKFIHKGIAANCLSVIGSSDDCLSFANGEEYLVKICNLGEDEKLNDTVDSRKISEYI